MRSTSRSQGRRKECTREERDTQRAKRQVKTWTEHERDEKHAHKQTAVCRDNLIPARRYSSESGARCSGDRSQLSACDSPHSKSAACAESASLHPHTSPQALYAKLLKLLLLAPYRCRCHATPLRGSRVAPQLHDDRIPLVFVVVSEQLGLHESL
jgi:hypothetical protein